MVTSAHVDAAVKLKSFRLEYQSRTMLRLARSFNKLSHEQHSPVSRGLTSSAETSFSLMKLHHELYDIKNGPEEEHLEQKSSTLESNLQSLV
jgi:hypothetical protein